MLIGICFLVAGILLLYFGAEGLVAGASRLAMSLGITPLVIGATVVAFGTSLPELMASLIALFQGQKGDMALGNVIGSNVANIGLILGVGALIKPIEIPSESKRREFPFVVFASLLMGGMMLLGPLGLTAGALFLICLMIYLYLQVKVSQKHRQNYRDKVAEKELKEVLETPTQQEVLKDLLLVGVGLGGLFFGGYLLVEGAVIIAKLMGISERVIGLILLAFGTSCPELATVVVGSLQSKHDLSIGNILGSNIFNIFAILSVCAFIRPIVFDQTLLMIDLPVMLLFTFVLGLFMLIGGRINRLGGAIFLIGYLAYVFGILF